MTEQFISKLFQFLFYLNLILASVLTIFLTTRSLLYATQNHHFYPLHWYPPLFSSTLIAGITAFAWQYATFQCPSATIKAAFWLSPMLTCAVSFLFFSIGSPLSLAGAVIALLLAVAQSLYGCWVNPHFAYAAKILSVSIDIPYAKTTRVVALLLITAMLLSCFLVSGIGGATASRTNLDTLFKALLLITLAWTMHVVKNTIQVSISRITFTQITSNIIIHTHIALRDTINNLMGFVCFGSAVIPFLAVIRGSARAVRLLAGDTDEFMFSCAYCYFNVASTLIRYGNRWGLVQVGVHKKGFVQASKDTWEMFVRMEMVTLIDNDLTGAFCFLCGVAGGSISAISAGSWALAIHDSCALEVSVYAFLMGYFMVRDQQILRFKYYKIQSWNPPYGTDVAPPLSTPHQ